MKVGCRIVFMLHLFAVLLPLSMASCVSTKTTQSLSVTNEFGKDLIGLVVIIDGQEHDFPILRRGDTIWIPLALANDADPEVSISHSEGEEGWAMIRGRDSRGATEHQVTIMELVTEIDPEIFRER